jgi:hypothetical protein
MSYYATTDMPSEAWAASPMNGVDLNAEAGVSLGGNAWHSRMTVDLWSFIIIIGALVALWVLGGVVFRRVNVL